MKSLIFILAISLLFSSCPLILAQLFEDPELVKPIDTFEEIEQIRSGKSDHLSCIFFHTKKCQRCEQAVPAVEKLAKNYLDIVNVYDVNCHTLWRDLEENEKSQVSICDPENKSKMPQIQFFQVPTRKINPYTNQPMKAMETPYQGEASAFGLSDFAVSMIPSFRTFVGNKKELNEFLRYKKIPTKVTFPDFFFS
jgi:thiol-disulfide isomerase/thioredoxin